uniref:Uncharacterized protein n=1 Tax=Ralstonia solanacearum TaxID=305 RepID=A0A0S4X1H2_RALSL|nr:protein of unknown function [Ralstonia solanacearum]
MRVDVQRHPGSVHPASSRLCAFYLACSVLPMRWATRSLFCNLVDRRRQNIRARQVPGSWM